MPARVEVNPELLAWARQRSGLASGDLAHRFPKLATWEQGEQLPTLKQLESYAQATHTPWLGAAALDDADLISTSPAETERWCNQVAAEVLLPLSAVAGDRPAGESLTTEIERLAQRFKVSNLVVLRRIYDTRRLSWNDYRTAYQTELERVMGLLGEQTSRGGNFFNTHPARVSRRFTRAVITSTLEGQTLYRDAFQMLGFKKTSTFNELASRLGIS